MQVLAAPCPARVARAPCVSRVSRPRRLRVACSVTTPHSGYHFDGTGRRFFEGWYWKVVMPDTGQSFALIYSVEDPLGNTPQAGVGLQVMGPDDGYICQFSPRVDGFWAAPHRLELGATFTPAPAAAAATGSNTHTGSPRGPPRGMLGQDQFFQQVSEGFQASQRLQQGRMVAREEGAAGPPMSTVSSASWCLSITPRAGWGSPSARHQQATAGWLSALPVFEPHWQVLMAHGEASGWLQWGERRFSFSGAPAYAEKNWGGGFPSKWAWVQCNSFEGQPGLSVTSVGARRGLLVGLPGVEEDVGLLGLHLPPHLAGGGGEFVELVPWNSELEWEVSPWGSWRLRGANSRWEALLEAECEAGAGAVLRAPTTAQGLAPFCKDTFFGRCRLRL
ncbi:hypothetical protein Agub_g15190, partial [Astrephomene gubernaculifera]